MSSVSKSRFQSGLACLRRAYLEAHSPELAKAPSLADQERMRAGQEVGRLARQLFEGVLIDVPSYDMERAALATQQAISDGAQVLFEAAFVTDDSEVRVDVLERSGDGWHLIEVKSSKSVKQEHLSDVAFQRMVLERAGLRVVRASLLLISDEYRRSSGMVDVERLFVLEDVTEETDGMLPTVAQQHAEVLGALSGAEAPDVVLNVHCKRDGECRFLAHCWRGMPLHDVTTLPLIKAEAVHELHTIGVRDIALIPDETRLSARQRLVASVVQTGVPFVSKELGSAIAVEEPLHFLDFEATNSAVPEYEGIAPYRHVPFQWSDHVVAHGAVRHMEFLHRSSDDPRPEFARTLWEALAGAATVCYYSSYERSILKALAADGLPGARESLGLIEERGLDLEKVVREHVYLAEFMGKTSIKLVYPALVPGAGYRDLAIADGDMAAAEFRRMLSPATTPREAERIARDLLSYCERDTQAMLEVFNALQRLAATPSAPSE